MINKNFSVNNSEIDDYNPYTIQDELYPCWNCGCNSINYYILIYSGTVVAMIIIFLLILVYALILFRSKKPETTIINPNTRQELLTNKVQYSY